MDDIVERNFSLVWYSLGPALVSMRPQLLWAFEFCSLGDECRAVLDVLRRGGCQVVFVFLLFGGKPDCVCWRLRGSVGGISVIVFR